MRHLFLTISLLIIGTLNAQSLQKAQDFLDRSDYARAVPLYEKIAKDATNLDIRVAAQNGLADCYLDLGANYKAMAILKKNIVLLNKPSNKNFLLLAKTHQLLAICYDKLHLIEDYLKECTTFYYYYKKAAPNKKIYKALYYAYVGRYYNMRFIVDKAYVYTNSALKIYHKDKNEKEVDPYIFYNAHLFTERSRAPTLAIKFQYVDSLRYFLNKRYPYDNLKKARLMVSIAAPNIEVAANLYHNSGDYNLNIECANRAISLYDEAIAMNDKFAGCYHVNAAFLNSLKGLMLFYKKEYKGALENYEIGIKRLTLSPYVFTNNNVMLLDLLKWKAWCLDDMYSQNKDTKLLYEIDKTLLLEEKYWVQYANVIYKNKQKFNTNEYTSSPYNDLSKNYYKLFEATGKEKYITLYYEYNEKSKYSSLLDNLFKERKEPRSTISATRIEKIHETFDDLILKTNNKIIFTENNKSAFENQYKIYSAKQNKLDFFNKEKIVALQEVQNKLKDNEAILSYNVTGYQAYFYPFILIITKSKIKIVELKIENSDFHDQKSKVVRLHKSLEQNNIPTYKKLGYDCYINYFKPIVPFLPKSVTNIQIITSDFFCNLPFDMLLTEQSKSNDFSKLPYLLKKYQLSYGLSSSISNIVDRNVSKTSTFSVFSPSFSSDDLSELKESNKASKELRYLYNAKLIEGKNATKQIFSKQLTNDRIVALLSHGRATVDEIETNKGIYLSDGFLSLNDVYNLEAHCDFLLLGTCESGVGLKNKEGTINLARAFTAIGVKSMMLASWKIDEKSSTQIISSFLKYLDSGCTKSEALQKAKLDYLATTSPRMANPLYWAGLTITGNNETIPLQERNYWWWGFFSIPIIAGGLYYRKRRKKSL